MKGIAFAIICAAYVVLPSEEANKWDTAFTTLNAVTWLICVMGFWTCIIFERSK